MLRHLLAVLPALLLTACLGSTSSTRLSSTPKPPRVPAQALLPCLPSPAQRQPDGSAAAADTEATIRARTIDLATCDARRKLAVDAWPR